MWESGHDKAVFFSATFYLLFYYSCFYHMALILSLQASVFQEASTTQFIEYTGLLWLSFIYKLWGDSLYFSLSDVLIGRQSAIHVTQPYLSSQGPWIIDTTKFFSLLTLPCFLCTVSEKGYWKVGVGYIKVMVLVGYWPNSVVLTQG